MIQGVETKQLKPIPDERGMLMEILRSDDKMFKKFGQVYMTTAYPGVVKAWHYHKKQTDNFCCVKGMAKVVLYDARKNSKTYGEINEFIIGERNQVVVLIPPFVYHGFKCVSENEMIIINCSTEPYDRKKPDEYRVPIDCEDVPYNWDIKIK